jgi:hypothetical protein
MRLKRPTQSQAAIRCPSCRRIFEVDSASLADEPIVAEVIEEPIMVVEVVDDIEPVSVVVVEEPSYSQRTQPAPVVVREAAPQVPLRPVLPNKGSAKTKPSIQRSHADRDKKRRLMLITAIVAGFAFFGLGAFFLTKLFFGSAPSAVEQLATRYEEKLLAIRQSILSHKASPNHDSVNNQVSDLRKILVDCVNTPTTDIDLKAVQKKILSMNELTAELRRLSNELAPTFSRKSLVDQVPSMIELINKQLQNGIRGIKPGREPIDQFLTTAFSEYRQIDRSLGKAVLENTVDLDEICPKIDELDHQIVAYSQSATSRSEIGFDTKLVLESGATFRAWCFRQLQLSDDSVSALAVSKELESISARFDSAIKAVTVDSQKLAARDRVDQRINGPTMTTITGPGKAESIELGSSTPSNPDNSIVQNNSPALNSIGGTNSPKSSNNNSIVIADSNKQPSINNANNSASPSTPSGSSFVDASSTSQESESPFMEANTGNSSSNLASNTSSSSSSPSEKLFFPSPRYQGPNTLSIKVVSTKSKAELQKLGLSIASRIGGVVNLQAQGNLTTLSFSNFTGKVHEAVKHVNFGKVEIADTQSRTLFVNDSN